MIGDGTLAADLGPKPQFVRTTARVLAGVLAALIAVTAVLAGTALASGWPVHSALVLGPFLPLLPFAAFVAWYWSFAFTHSVLEMSADGIVLRNGIQDQRMPWQGIGRVFAPRSYGQVQVEPFPALIVMESAQRGAGTSAHDPESMAVQPGQFASLDELRGVLERLLSNSPPATVHPDVALLYALALRAQDLAQQEDAVDAAALDPGHVLVRRWLASASPENAGVTAPFEYFLGNEEKALGQCADGLKLAGTAWDLLLCRSLCEQALGHSEQAADSLKAAVAAAPSEVAAALQSTTSKQ
jgi:hypothetical protein